MTSPAEGQVNDTAWNGDGVEGTQGLDNHGALLTDVSGFTQRVTEWPAQEYGAGRLHLLGIFTHDRYPDGGDAGFLDLSLDQSNGLIADASGRGQQDDINPVLLELFHDLFCRMVNQGCDVSAIDVAHERVVGCGQSA